MEKLKEAVKKIPVLPSVYRMLKRKYLFNQLKSEETEHVFNRIYKNNAWGGKNSVSGTGSEIHQTKIIIEKLPTVFRDFGISTILDIPCGDFHWMKNVDLCNIKYTGADIVNDLIEENKKQYEREGVNFQELNLIKDKLPKADLVLCRDCLVHLSFVDIFYALDNLCNSQAEYALITTFTKRVKNCDIATGQWRTLNLEVAPFMFPKALRIINEGCTEGNGSYKDKSLGLWRISDIRESLTRR